jgi:TonB family protein
MQCEGTNGKPARRGRARLLRGPLALSLLLHVVGLGAALVWAAQHDVRPAPTRIGAITVRAVEEQLTVRPEPDVLEPLPLEPELPWRDALEQVVLDSRPVDLEHPFEEETQPSERPPPTFQELPLSAARRPRPAPPVAPLPPPPAVRPPAPQPRPTVIRIRPPPRPTPRPTPRVAPSVRRAAPLRVVSAPDPRRYYPPSAVQRSLAGRAWVRLLIDAHGRVTDAHVEQSSGYSLLDRAAVSLAYAYRFSAGAGPRTTRLPVTFRPPQRGFGS